MLLAALVVVVAFSNPSGDQPKATPVKNEAGAEMVAPWNARFPTLWKKNKGVGIPAGLPWKEQVTLRPWSENGKRFDDPIEKVDARRVQHDGATAFVLIGKQVKRGGPTGQQDHRRGRSGVGRGNGGGQRT